MKKLIFLVIAAFFSVTTYSVYLKMVPIELNQPDVNVIHCFLIGNEFHQRVHDKEKNTIVKNVESAIMCM